MHQNLATSIHAGEVLFTLIVKADKAGNVGEMITLNSGVTAAESQQQRPYSR
ncbi:MAG: hypothetical protein IPP49_21095 [Saprospiraceae bacterium]|nr:hypothetical protein [Saprospiraceae bacterium]